MKKALLGGFALALVLAVSGCGDSYESVAKDSVKVMNEAADIYEGIKSKEDAEKAKPKLEKLAKNVPEVLARLEKAGFKESEALTMPEHIYNLRTTLNDLYRQANRVLKGNAVVKPE